MQTAVTIAHLTDVHLGPIAGFAPRHWNVKRALGYANWRRNRRHAYRMDVLRSIVADLKAQAPDHIAVTGDLVNIGLPQELAAALRWLESLGTPDGVTVIPGNHDIYCRLRGDPGTQRWSRFMSPCGQGAAYAAAGAEFPFVRMLGRVAIIGINSAVPTPPLIARGRVGAGQLARLDTALERLARAGAFRLVLIHHPPLPGLASRLRGLEDARDVEAVLARRGAELVLHGHNHRSMLSWCAAGPGPIPIVGAPSASLGRSHGREPLARYNLYRIAGPPWSVDLVGRGLAQADGPVVELERRTLLPAGLCHEERSCKL
jgi:3',5'-cyclic AMP phosphodiesterase CpdA